VIEFLWLPYFIHDAQVQDGIGRKFGDMEQYFVQVYNNIALILNFALRIMGIKWCGWNLWCQVVASFAASFYLSWELTVVLLGSVPFIGLAGWFMIGTT
jgi:ABC-type multidrug transport system fused ATPase/permease subunit